MRERLAGKVAFITGAGRGQGHSHAGRMAEDGADIIAVDICAPIPTVTNGPPTTAEDLDETVRLVEKQNGRIVAKKRSTCGIALLCNRRWMRESNN